MAKKNRVVIGTIGIIILIFGVIMTITFGIRGEEYIYELIFTALAVIIGLILLAGSATE